MKISHAQFNKLHYLHQIAPGLFVAALKALPPPGAGMHGLGDTTGASTSTTDSWVNDITSLVTSALPTYTAYKVATNTPTVTVPSTSATSTLLAKYGITTGSVLLFAAVGAAIFLGVKFLRKKKSA